MKIRTSQSGYRTNKGIIHQTELQKSYRRIYSRNCFFPVAHTEGTYQKRQKEDKDDDLDLQKREKIPGRVSLVFHNNKYTLTSNKSVKEKGCNDDD